MIKPVVNSELQVKRELQHVPIRVKVHAESDGTDIQA